MGMSNQQTPPGELLGWPPLPKEDQEGTPTEATHGYTAISGLALNKHRL